VSRTASTPPPALGVVRGRRMTNRQLAERLEVSEGWVGKVLLGHVRPPLRFRQELAALLEVPAEVLFPRERERG
jgi:transcriptional regulator with XRE-family HTH domain